jgi:hypothetical protein
MIICSSSNIDLIQGVSGYGTAADGATDWRIENTTTGVFNILNSPNLLAPNVSIIDAGNVGIGTIPVTGTNKLQVQGDTSVSGLITATKTTAGTNDILAMRYDSNNGIRFQQTLVAANDVRYDIIQKTNNADYTTPAISIYKGNVGIGTNNPNAELQVTCASTATNPDTGGTIIGLYVHNPTNTATQNSVILNRIAGSSAGKVIYAFNVAGSYGCSLSINGSDTTNRLLRFNSNSDATGTDLMVINNNNGNVGIGTQVDTTGSHKLSITGNVNVSGGYFVGGNAFKPATAVLADTATALATSRNIAGVGFNGSAAIDIPYFNLTNKITAGTGISLTSGSATTSPSISTNLTAGTNVTFSGTAPNITINATGGAASQWSGASGGNIYYNSGNVGIGTATLTSGVSLDVNGSLLIRTFDNSAGGTKGIFFRDTQVTSAPYNCSILTFDHSGDNYCDGLSINAVDGISFCAGSNTRQERMRIASNGNIGIGTASAPSNSLTGSPILAVGTNGYGISGDNGPSSGGIYIGDSVVAARWRISHGSYNMNLFQNNGSGTYDARGSFANSTGVYSSVSDKRLKKLIEPIQYGLNDVLKFKPVSYFMENQNEDIDKRNLGFIAQDLEDIIPEIVNVPSTSNAVYSLQYSSIIPILIKAVQELNDKIISLNNTSNVM